MTIWNSREHHNNNGNASQLSQLPSQVSQLSCGWNVTWAYAKLLLSLLGTILCFSHYCADGIDGQLGIKIENISFYLIFCVYIYMYGNDLQKYTSPTWWERGSVTNTRHSFGSAGRKRGIGSIALPCHSGAWWRTRSRGTMARHRLLSRGS